MAQTILVVDDDALIRQSVAYLLERAGYRVQTAGSAETGFVSARTERPDLVLLDINLPGVDGLQALRTFRDELSVPVIFVTARRREFDEILGLELGANDYITKPFEKEVLLARVRTTLRNAGRVARAERDVEEDIHVGDLVISPPAYSVTVRGKPISLSPREYRLLYTLALKAGHVVPTDELLESVWGTEFAGQMQVVYVHIRWLREKIEENPEKPSRILTVRGVGYKLVAPVE